MALSQPRHFLYFLRAEQKISPVWIGRWGVRLLLSFTEEVRTGTLPICMKFFARFLSMDAGNLRLIRLVVMGIFCGGGKGRIKLPAEFQSMLGGRRQVQAHYDSGFLVDRIPQTIFHGQVGCLQIPRFPECISPDHNAERNGENQ